MTAEHILAKDIAAFERRKPELLQRYNGKFVILHADELEGSFDSFRSRARRVDALSGLAVSDSAGRCAGGDADARFSGVPPGECR